MLNNAWLSKADIRTKSDNTLINTILNTRKDWTTLFMQRLKTTQQQLDKREAFMEEMQVTFWAPKPNCEKELNDEDKQFLSNTKGSREGGVSSLDRVTMAKSKRKMETVLQIQERKHKEKKRKLISEVIPSSVIEKYEDSESNLSRNAGKDTDLFLPKPSKKRKKERKQKKRPVVSLSLNPTEWSKTVNIVADKHHISHRGLTEVMSAAIHSGSGSINDLSLSKDTVLRHRNKIREHKTKSIYQTNIKAIKTSENNRYLLHWDGKMLHGLEHVETSSEVVTILLTCFHEKREILLKVENETEGHIPHLLS